MWAEKHQWLYLLVETNLDLDHIDEHTCWSMPGGGGLEGFIEKPEQENLGAPT